MGANSMGSQIQWGQTRLKGNLNHSWFFTYHSLHLYNMGDFNGPILSLKIISYELDAILFQSSLASGLQWFFWLIDRQLYLNKSLWLATRTNANSMLP